VSHSVLWRGIGAPYGTRTRVTAVKGRCPGPLDEGRIGGRGGAATYTFVAAPKQASEAALHPMQDYVQCSIGSGLCRLRLSAASPRVRTHAIERVTAKASARRIGWPHPPRRAGCAYHLPVFGIDFQGSAGGSASPFCSSSMDCLSGERTNAIMPSRGGRLMVTPAFNMRSHTA
jgi:hypothetical protein